MKVTITINDNKSASACDMDMRFEPALTSNTSATPAVRTARICLEAVRAAAKRIKSTEILTTDEKKTNGN